MPKRKHTNNKSMEIPRAPLIAIDPLEPLASHHSLVSFTEASDMLSQDGCYLIEDPTNRISHELCASTLAAYGVIPGDVRHVVVSCEGELPDLVRKSCPLFSIRSRDERGLIDGRIRENLSFLSANHRQNMNYSGHVSKGSIVTIMRIGIAATILNISYLGRGLPTGSHFQHSLRYFIDRPEALSRIVETISDRQLVLPELLKTSVQVSDWKKDALIQNHIYTQAVPNSQKQLKENLHSFIPYAYSLLARTETVDETSQASALCHEYVEIQRKLWDVVKILKSYTDLLTLHEEEELPTSIGLQDDFADKCLEAFRLTGAENAVLAYFDGVPIADVMA